MINMIKDRIKQLNKLFSPTQTDRYQSHLVSRDTYERTNLGDFIDGRKIVEGFVSDGEFVFVTKDAA